MSEEIEVKENEKQEEWHHVVTLEDLGDLKRKLHIVYDTTGVTMAFDQAAELIKKRVQIKGFRKGKAPVQLVKNYCSKEIEESASSMLSQEGFLHACYENKIQPLSEPDIENAEFHIDGTFSCDIVLEIKPQIEPTGYVGLQLTKAPATDEKKALEELINQAKQEHMKQVPIDEVVAGAIVCVDFEVRSVESDELVSQGEDHYFVVLEGQEPPFGENLLSKKIGDEFREQISMPETSEAYAGEEVVVLGTIKSIFERVLPTDEEFVEAMQAPSQDALMETFTNELKKRERQQLEEQVITKLLELHQFDVPRQWVDDEERYLVQQLGLKGELSGDIKTQVQQMAERNVRRTFILEAIYDAEQTLRLTKDDLDSWLAREAEYKQISPEALKKSLQEQGVLDAVVGMIKHSKVLEFILSQAEITEQNDSQEEPESNEIPENPLG